MQFDIPTVFFAVIGMTIFGFYLFRSGQNRSLETTMELGLVITLLAGSLLYNLSPIIQVAVLTAGIMLLLRKGFV